MCFSKAVVKYRIPILILTVLLMIPAVIGIANTRINYDMLNYLPEDMDTIIGQNELMEDFGKGAFSFIILVEGESDQLYLSALKNLLISKGKISPLKEIVFIPTGGVKGIKATSAILSGVNEVKPPVLIDGDKPSVKMFNELKADFYAADTDKLIMVTDFSTVPEAEVEDLLPKAKLAKVIARFLPRPEDTDEEFDDVVVDNKPICNQIEEFAKAQGIDLGGKGWKVRLAAMVKREILKGTDKVICESDPEFAKILELFTRFS